jgi:hypothetical protein
MSLRKTAVLLLVGTFLISMPPVVSRVVGEAPFAPSIKEKMINDIRYISGGIVTSQKALEKLKKKWTTSILCAMHTIYEITN